MLRNEGEITASHASDAAGTTAPGLVIEAGAHVTALQNSQRHHRQGRGTTADAVAIIDRSGSLAEWRTSALITAGRTLTDPPRPVTGHDVALDLSANTTGVHLLQTTPAGATLVPAIAGSVTLGSGGDRVEILAGTLKGDLDLGAGANALTIDNGATVIGRAQRQRRDAGPGGRDGPLQINNASQLSLTSLNLGAGTSLVVTADPAAGRPPSWTSPARPTSPAAPRSACA